MFPLTRLTKNERQSQANFQFISLKWARFLDLIPTIGVPKKPVGYRNPT